MSHYQIEFKDGQGNLLDHAKDWTPTNYLAPGKGVNGENLVYWRGLRGPWDPANRTDQRWAVPSGGSRDQGDYQIDVVVPDGGKRLSFHQWETTRVGNDNFITRIVMIEEDDK